MSPISTLFFLLVVINIQFALSEDVEPFIKYVNGTVVRSQVIPLNLVPPQLTPDLATKVVSKDVFIGKTKPLSARVYLPRLSRNSNKLPILVYFHGGGFCIGSAFSYLDHLYMNKVSSFSHVIAISVNYRLFPDYALPAAFDDAWFALNWVAKQGKHRSSTEPWLASHGDFSRVFIGGDSSMRASLERLSHGLQIYGAILATPYFLGSTLVPFVLPHMGLCLPRVSPWGRQPGYKSSRPMVAKSKPACSEENASFYWGEVSLI